MKKNQRKNLVIALLPIIILAIAATVILIYKYTHVGVFRDEKTVTTLALEETANQKINLFKTLVTRANALETGGENLGEGETTEDAGEIYTITYDVTTATKGNVIATIVFENENVVITNSADNTHTFEENGSFAFEYENEAGKTGKAVATVSWIYKTAPVATISYDIETLTNQNVTATITFDRPNVRITNNEEKNTYVFDGNKSFTFEFEDEVGNAGSQEVTVTWIDKVPPVATITYSEEDPTNRDVTATISFNKENVTVTGGNTHTFTDKGEYTFEYVDEAGNIGTAVAKVTWIYKTAPEPSVRYSTTELTNQNVTAEIYFENPEIFIFMINSKYTFEENGSHTFTYEDEAGNKGEKTVTVDWIDKEAPVATITYSEEDPTNQDVTATIEFDEEDVTITSDGGAATHTFEENGTYTFTYEDKLGNEGTAVAEVSWIYKTAPEPSIKYSTTDPTNQDVTVEIYFENIEIIVAIPNDKYTFTENGSHTFTYEDEAGNTGEKTVTVDWIDKEAPIGTITYDINELTNQDVTATISFNEENVTVTNNEGATTHTFTENDTFTFEFEDEAGNTATATAEVTWIDKIPPVATIEYSEVDPTNQDVIATISFNKENVTVVGGNTHTFTDKGEYTFEFEDEAGNTGTAVAKVTWIYKTAPEPSIKYSTTEPTNQDVTVEIYFENIEIIVAIPNDKYTFTENGSHTFTYEDEAGNTGEKTVTVDWIDKEAPIGTITYDINELTNRDVTATISFNEENVTVTNNEGATTYTFTENDTFTFEFEDEAGNTATATAEVTWIDKVAPEGTIEFSTTEPTNQNVIAKILFDEDEVTVIGGETHTFTKNGKYTFRYVDALGNEGSKEVIVDWIDKEAPIGTITYDIDRITNQDVTATISFNEENVTVTNNEGATTYTFTENDTFTFEFVDEAGNTATATAEVTWIDKIPPVATIEYSEVDPTNQDVIATITFNKENVTVVGGNTHTFTDKGEYTFEYVDEAGNTGTAVAKVTWIYKTAPEPSIKYSTTELTNQNVTAEIYFKDVEIMVFIVNDKYTFTENGSHTFTYEDEAGNRGEKTITVDWIDKEAPVGTITYDINELTNQNVTATISFNEENVTVTNNEGATTYTFSENDTFTFEFVDQAGNTATATADVTWIDKDAPEGTITYDINELTNKDVTATISFNEENVTVTGGNTHTFEENGVYIFEFVDQAGNTGTATAEVSWIDKIPPEGTIKYSTTNPTNQDVTATIVFEEEEVKVIGGETHTFIKNGKYTFEYVDALGNRGTKEAEVNWIDKDAPEGTITYDINELTNKNVTATISFNEENVTVTNNEGATTYTFTGNNTFTFEFIDQAGNTGTAIANVNWIDKVAPEASIEYSETKETKNPVIAKLVNATKDITIINNNGLDTYKFIRNGMFTFIIEDRLGNRNEIQAIVDWIDTREEDSKVTSDEYKVEDLYIKNVPVDTKVSELKSKLNAVAEIVIKDNKGNIAKENEVVTTGMKVTAGINEYTVVVLGDLDGNGQVSITDLAKLCLHYIGKEELTGAYKEAADLDGNNEITTTDLAKLKLILVDENK